MGMTEADWLYIGEGTQGYSGADMSILVRDALMEPIRTLQTATHFRKVPGVDKDGVEHPDMWEGCSPGAEGAVEMSLMDLPDAKKLLEPKLCRDHFEAVLEHSNPSVAEGDLEEFVEFTANYGQEGA